MITADDVINKAISLQQRQGNKAEVLTTKELREAFYLLKKEAEEAEDEENQEE